MSTVSTSSASEASFSLVDENDGPPASIGGGGNDAVSSRDSNNCIPSASGSSTTKTNNESGKQPTTTKQEDCNFDSPPKLQSPSSLDDEALQDASMASSEYIVKQLKELYHSHVVEAEKRYHLHFNFCLPTDGEIKDSEFDATPMVLLIGQYSTGKTTFISHLLGHDFPGMHIGPEPTTDKFMAIFHGGDKNNNSFEKANAKFEKRFHSKKHPNDNDSISSRSIATDDIVAARGRLIKGNTLTVTPSLPFSSLSQFGSAFLNHFVGSSSSSPLLKRLTFIDTPGVLSGEKQRINRTYDVGQVCKWFADRCDLILLLFDAHKLDISDELKDVIDTIRPYNDDKIRCVLNKADGVTREQLVRVYGSLMWSMGKIFDSPEVVRVYTGSYWNGSLINSDFEHMFEKDEQLLVRELVDLPRCAAERKVNQMVNRIRMVKVHVCILGTLREMTPRLFGKKKSREQILNDLDAIMERVRMKFDLSKGDMPSVKDFARCLENFPDFSAFPPIDVDLIKILDRLIEKDIPTIVSDADVVISDFREGRSREVVGIVETHGENEEEEEAVEELKSIATKDEICFTNKTRKVSTWTQFFVKVVSSVFAIILIAEILYYWSFVKAAYSLSELYDGCVQILEQVVDYFGSDGTKMDASEL